jgi:hypothetical protein
MLLQTPKYSSEIREAFRNSEVLPKFASASEIRVGFRNSKVGSFSEIHLEGLLNFGRGYEREGRIHPRADHPFDPVPYLATGA